jgi:eukaryotic-like serine/threonine-protein kinase
LDELIGRVLGQFRLVQRVGAGGMGTVYRAYQTSLNRDVAIKVLPGHMSRDAGFIERFRREAVAAAQLAHPNIVRVYDFVEQDGIYYLVMDYISGASLAERMKTAPVGLPMAAAVTRDIGSALDYAHARGLVHRDVKPSNILLTPEGHAMLTDFGIARAASESRMTQTGVIVGTPEYMSPEQAQGLALDGRADLYSLGVVLYEMLAGRVPFKAETPVALLYQQVHELPTPPSRLGPGIPRGVEQAIMRALHKNRDLRFATGQEMARALDDALAGRTRSPFGQLGKALLGSSTQSRGTRTPVPVAKDPGSRSDAPVSDQSVAPSPDAATVTVDGVAGDQSVSADAGGSEAGIAVVGLRREEQGIVGSAVAGSRAPGRPKFLALALGAGGLVVVLASGLVLPGVFRTKPAPATSTPAGLATVQIAATSTVGVAPAASVTVGEVQLNEGLPTVAPSSTTVSPGPTGTATLLPSSTLAVAASASATRPAAPTATEEALATAIPTTVAPPPAVPTTAVPPTATLPPTATPLPTATHTPLPPPSATPVPPPTKTRTPPPPSWGETRTPPPAQ